jgi:SAM-dependent methyltransferase
MSLDLIATYYDLIHGSLEEDWPMWQFLTQDLSGPILEIGCGSGRLLFPLAQAGHSLTGLDLSEVALRKARTKLEAGGLTEQVTLVQADMRHFDLPDQTFELAIMALNTFMHCHTTADQLATLQAIHRHLNPGGQLAIDLFYPDPIMLAEVDGRLYFETEIQDETTGHIIQWYWQHDIDLAQQMRHLTYILDAIDQQGNVRRVTIPFSLRFLYRFEMELLLKMTGFEPETIYGSYDFEPFRSTSPRMIVLANKQ